MTILRDVAILIAVFAVVTVIAYALGAANWGVAATFGQLAFTAVLVWMLLTGRSSRGRPPAPGPGGGRGVRRAPRGSKRPR